MRPKVPRVNQVRFDVGAPRILVPVPAVEYVSLLFGDRPNIHKVVSLLNERFFNNEIRDFVFTRSSNYKASWGCTKPNTKMVILQNRLFSKGIHRIYLLRVLLHEMIHVYLDCVGACRVQSAGHGWSFQAEANRLKEALGLELLDFEDLERVLPLVPYVYRCLKCSLEVFHFLKRAPDNMPNYAKHRSSCGGTFIFLGKVDGARVGAGPSDCCIGHNT